MTKVHRTRAMTGASMGLVTCSCWNMESSARNGGLFSNELQHAVLEAAEAQVQQVARVVLVQLPRHLRAGLREGVDRALHVARGEIDDRLLGHARVVAPRRALTVAVAVHVVDQPAGVLRDEVALQRP